MTTIILVQIFTILIIHWVADFIFQTEEMATNKSKSNYWLTKHVKTYMFVLLPITLLIIYFGGTIYGAFFWLIINGSLHWCTDYITSRKTSKLYAAGDYHNFFVVIGFDQFIHYLCLFTTYSIFTS
jgi:membrane-bound metal-dependent hydrolase YbcI (DUF457 family)